MTDTVLPSIPLPATTVTIGESEIKIRSLTRAEAIQVKNDFEDDQAEAEIFIISCGTGISIDEAREWYNTTDVPMIGTLVEAIGLLTGGSTDPN